MTVTVTTRNARMRTYRFATEQDADRWIELLAALDPQSAQTALKADASLPNIELGHKGRGMAGR